jgi:hypothetical protein
VAGRLELLAKDVISQSTAAGVVIIRVAWHQPPPVLLTAKGTAQNAPQHDGEMV